MKLTAIILISACLAASANGRAQSVTLNVENVPVQKVFKEVSRQTGISIVYSETALKKLSRVTIHVKNVSINEVMDQCLKGQPFEYSIEGNVIVVKEKEKIPNEEATIINEPPPPIDITGKVTDADGNPLAGATVKVKGSSKGTTTNSDGMFQLKGVDDNATLEISFVGYETYTIAVNNKSTIVASLKVKPESLNEVVINKGYYTEKQKYSVGNVGKVTAKDIEKQPVNNPLLALQGRVPGLSITQINGLPGSLVKVTIQGRNSVRFDGSDPLYVIDGVPYVSQTPSTTNIGTMLQNAGGSSGYGSPLSFINASDIESIEILKDADATAIYGSRAANGAILITTKKGKAGPARVGINVQNGWGKVTRSLDLMNTNQYLEMRNEALKNDSKTISSTDYDINGFWDTTRYTNWQKELIGNTAKYLNINTSISGGTDYVQYLIGGTYQKQTVVFPGELSDRKGTLHCNINTLSNNRKFKVELTGSYLSDVNTLPGTDLTATALRLAPNSPSLYNQDGSINWAPNSAGSSTWDNPLAQNLRSYESRGKNLVGNSLISYQLLSGLEIKSNFGYSELRIDEYNSTPIESQAPENRAISTRISNYSQSTINNWIVEPQLNYHKRAGKGELNALLGSTFQSMITKGSQLRGSGYGSDAVMKDIRAATSLTVLRSEASEYKYSAVFARLNYNLSGKYLINLTARRDGSSRFGSENLFNNFWGIGTGWILSEEKLFKKTFSFLSYAKVRFSYGTTGNDQIGNYKFMNLYNVVSAGIPYQSIPAYAPVGHANPHLQWESTKKLNAGLDFNLFGDRLAITTNFVRNRSSNQLIDYALPIATGFMSVAKNLPATVQNTEWQFSANTVNVKNQVFNWTSSVNLTIPRNKLISFPDLQNSSYASQYVIGQPLDIVRVYKFWGVDPATGLYIVADKNGNSISNPQVVDRTVTINLSPQYYGGLQNSFQYKAFQFDIFFQFVKQLGKTFYRGGAVLPGNKASNQPVTVLNRWRIIGDATDIQRFNVTAFTQYTNMGSSDVAFANASFARLKNLVLSYQLPQNLLKKAKIQDARIFINGQNLLTITQFEGLDPETGNSSLPPLKIIAIGFNLVL